MKKPKVTKDAKAGDKAVAIGGFLAVLLTGFFGAEPDAAMQANARAMIATTPYVLGTRGAEQYFLPRTVDSGLRDCVGCRE